MLDNVWRKAQDEFGFYTVDRFSQVPTGPGVYAWFYPLKLSSKDLETFVNQVDGVLRFERSAKNERNFTGILNSDWYKFQVSLTPGLSLKRITSQTKDFWNETAKNEEDFLVLREGLLKASILLPPLYVGKAKNLKARLDGHLADSDKNCFGNRFKNYAEKVGLPANKLHELIFVTITTKLPTSNETHGYSAERMFEDILISLCAPPFSER